MEALKQVQLTPLYPIELPEYYAADVWDISKLDLYKKANEKAVKYWHAYGHHNDCYDFSICKNVPMKQEIKYFFYTYIEINHLGLRSLAAHLSRVRHLISYINEFCLQVPSITLIEENDYTNYLVKNKLIKNTQIQADHEVNKDMKAIRKTRKNRTITLLKYIQKTLNDLYNAHIPEKEKDYWEIKRIPFAVQHNQISAKNLDFRNVAQNKIKQQLKDYCYFRLRTIVAATVHSQLNFIKVFTTWLAKAHPEMQDLSNYSRELLREYFSWLRIESGKNSSYYSQAILHLKQFIEIGIALDFSDFPTSSYISRYDYACKKVINPKYYSDEEMKNINAVLEKLPKKYAKIIFCLEVLALRISDLLTLKIENIKKSKKGYIIELTQAKTGNPIILPLPDSVYKVLISQYKESQKEYGSDVTYIFATSNTSHISYPTVNRSINKYFYKYKVLGDNGEILRFKSHKFRATKTTKLIQMGKGATEAAKVLGHSGLSSLSHYASVTDDTLIASMEPYLKKVELLVNNIGKIESINEEDFKGLIPLCNGWCARPSELGVCKHANYCLSCDLFKPDPRHLNAYSLHLEEINAALAIATQDNNELLIKKLSKDKEQLERIINEVKRLCGTQT